MYKIRLQKRFLWNLQQMSKMIRPFRWHQNFVPWGLSVCAPGLYTCIKSYKNCIKLDFKEIFFKLATNEWSDETFLLTSKLCPLGAVCPCPGAIYTCIKSWKNCIKSDFKEIFLKLATNDRSDKMFLLTLKFRPQGVVSPCPGATCIISWKKWYKIRLQRFVLNL